MRATATARSSFSKRPAAPATALSLLSSSSPLPNSFALPARCLPQFKRADVSSLLPVCGALVSVQQLAGLAAQYGVMLGATDVVGVRMAAFQLLTDVVSVRRCVVRDRAW